MTKWLWIGSCRSWLFTNEIHLCSWQRDAPRDIDTQSAYFQELVSQYASEKCMPATAGAYIDSWQFMGYVDHEEFLPS